MFPHLGQLSTAWPQLSEEEKYQRWMEELALSGLTPLHYSIVLFDERETDLVGLRCDSGIRVSTKVDVWRTTHITLKVTEPQTTDLTFCVAARPRSTDYTELCKIVLPQGDKSSARFCFHDNVCLPARLPLHILNYSGHFTGKVTLQLMLTDSGTESALIPCRWCNGSGIGLHPRSYAEVPRGCTRCNGTGHVPPDSPQTFW